MTNSNVWFYDISVSVNWAGLATISNITDKSAVLNYEADRYGDIYWVALAAGSPIPTAKQIIAGTDASGNLATIIGNSRVIAGSPLKDTLSGLAPNTNYDVHAVVQSKVLKTSSVETVSFTTEQAVDVSSIARMKSTNVYPNPCNGKFSIQSNDNFTHVEILNLIGNVVYSKSLNGETEIQTNLAAGIYFVVLKGASATKTIQIIVK